MLGRGAPWLRLICYNTEQLHGENLHEVYDSVMKTAYQYLSAEAMFLKL